MTTTQNSKPISANVLGFMKLLSAAAIVTVDNGAVLSSWDVTHATGDSDNEIVRFSWTDEDCDYSCILNEGEVATGRFDVDGTFICNDSEGEPTEVRMFSMIQQSPANVVSPALGVAIEALALAKECGGEIDLATYAQAWSALSKLRDDIELYDADLSRNERAPTGDDYNRLIERLSATSQ